MLRPSVICFWIGTALVVYTFIAYPLLIALAAWWWRRPSDRRDNLPSGFSIVLSVRNEQSHIARRIGELIKHSDSTGLPHELIIVCDGSTDDTASIARAMAQANVKVVEWSPNRGKSAALNQAASLAQNEILILCDARQVWDDDAIANLLECFRDPEVGAVSGQLVLKSPNGELAGVGLYWRFEKWLRGKEAQFHSQIGVTGAISAVRRELFSSLPNGLILDDVYWPMQVVMQGRRVIYQPLAVAFDELPSRSVDELRRKVRTLVGNFQLLSVCPRLLSPWNNTVWWQFVSHKVLRLVAPWALLLMLLSSYLIGDTLYRVSFLLLVAGLVVSVLGLVTPLGRRHRLFSAAGSFLLLQLAAWLAFWYWISGHSQNVWTAIQSQAATGDQV